MPLHIHLIHQSWICFGTQGQFPLGLLHQLGSATITEGTLELHIYPDVHKQKMLTLRHLLEVECHDVNHQPENAASNAAPALELHVPYPDYGKSPAFHLPVNKV